MSRHHSAHAGDVTHIINEINRMERVEAERVFGIQFQEGGKVYDEAYNKTFESVGLWAEFNVEQDELEYGEEFQERHSWE